MKCIAEDFVYEGIPYTLYTSSISKNKPVIFFCHGFKRNKYTGVGEMPLHLSRLGFNVVAIDAFLHGDRSEGWYEGLTSKEKEKHIFKVIMQTTKDIKTLIKVFKTVEEFDTSTFGMAGISMGGMISFYASSRIKDISVVVPMIGTPAFVGMVKDASENISLVQRIGLMGLEFVDPVRNYKKYISKKLLILNGLEDFRVPIDGSKQLYELLKDTDSVTEFKTYDCAHWISDPMKNDMYEWFVRYL